ncbi:MAG TPA: FAD-binding protein [Pseudonocardiaceae bacterium]
MTVTLTTLHGPQADLAEDVLDALRGQLRGHVLASPSSSGVPGTRDVFNAMHTGQPALIAQCTGTADVVDAVNFAHEHDLAVAVRGGGHSIAGLSTIDGGMLIDLSAMHGVQVDPEQRLAHVQGGAVLADLDRETQAFGLATPVGIISDTGVAGLTLGGGYGNLRRTYGLACDNVVQAQVVCADGQVRTASAEHNPDLFWAIRGGGGNFGIVTSFTFRLYPVGPIVAFTAPFYPLEDVAEVMRGWREYLAGAPDEVASTIVTVTMPAAPQMPEIIHNRAVAIVAGVYSGDTDEGMKVMQPLRELGTPLFDMSQPMPYTMVQSGFDPFFPRNTLRAYWKSQYLTDLTGDAIEVIAGRMLDRPSPLTTVNVWGMGGAIGAVGPEETAFAERSAPFMLEISGHWSDPAADTDTIGWVRSAWESAKPYGTGGVYLNFTGLSDEPMRAGVDDALGRNLRRLGKIKSIYDPENFFRYNNNILPTS